MRRFELILGVMLCSVVVGGCGGRDRVREATPSPTGLNDRAAYPTTPPEVAAAVDGLATGRRS